MSAPSADATAFSKQGIQTHAQNTMLANQLHKAISDSALRVAIGVGLEVPQIANMSLGVGGPTVRLAEWVEVRAGRGAAICVVAKLVDVHAALGRRVAAANVVGDGRGGGFGLLL